MGEKAEFMMDEFSLFTVLKKANISLQYEFNDQLLQNKDSEVFLGHNVIE